MNHPPRTAAEVMRILSRTHVGDAETPEIWRIEGPVFSTTASQIFRATSSRRERPIAVKATSELSANLQFEALEIASRALGTHKSFSSPAPIGLVKGEGLLLMDWIEGLTLSQMISSYRHNHHRLLEVGTMTGAMLIYLHKMESMQGEPLPVTRILNDIEDLVTSASPHCRRSSEPIIAILRTLANEVANTELRHARLHGDFKPANIILDSERLVCIDGDFRYVGPMLQDLSHFLNQFTLELYHPFALQSLRHSEDIQKAILSGYDDAMAAPEHLALNWLRLAKYLMMDLEQAKRARSKVKSKVLKACLNIEIRRTIHLLKRGSSSER